MKKFLSIAIVLAGMTACNSDKDNAAEKAAIITAYQDSIRRTADTAGLSAFQNWKAQNELSDAELYNQTQVAAVPLVQTAARPGVAPRRSTGTSSRSNRSVANDDGTMSSQSANTAKKKGWSKAAKGAAIGTAGGAVVGAVVNKKNRVAGGVVGGVLGAGVGYGIGRSKDKKDGRY